ncbi:hypothetical protein C8R48DRAFT_682345 [Suillus tomentosus]|nr:hypothetical protein C8R48DRAFT_682345 [Suillus tomentosus]
MQHIKASCLPTFSSLIWAHTTIITSPQTMRFTFVLAVAAALISATDAATDSEQCNFFCAHADDCCSDKPRCFIWVCSGA